MTSFQVRAVSLLLVIVILSYVAVGENAEPMCNVNEDCIFLNTESQFHFCYNGVCSECFQCALVNRVVPDTGCATTTNNCGPCKPGFDDIEVTGNSLRKKPCRPTMKTTTRGSAQPVADAVCTGDEHCFPGHFCYNQVCTHCFNCSLYKREAATAISCAKSVIDCGRCFPGYEETPLTLTSMTLKPCQPRASVPLTLVSSVAPGMSEDIMYVGTGPLLPLGVGLLICLIVMLFAFRRSRPAVVDDQCQVDVVTPADMDSSCLPPSYSEIGTNSCNSTQCEDYSEGRAHCGPASSTTVCGSYSEDKHVENTAKLLHPPTASYYTGEQRDGREQREHRVAGWLDEDDEATVPSSWTPQRPQSGEITNNTAGSRSSPVLNTTFTGVLCHMAGSASQSCPDLPSLRQNIQIHVSRVTADSGIRQELHQQDQVEQQDAKRRKLSD